MDAVKGELDGLMAAGTSAAVTDILEGCSIVDAKWL